MSASLNFLVALASLISFISLYIYQLPTHHCPFCILQKECSYLGYPVYAALLGGGLAGDGALILQTGGVSSLAPPGPFP